MAELATGGKAQTNTGKMRKRDGMWKLPCAVQPEARWSSWCMRIKIPNNWAPQVAQWRRAHFASAGDTGLNPGPGGLHMPLSP